MTKKCIGCGMTLQVEDSTKPGYTKSLEMDYCMRCFRIIHYHDLDFPEVSISAQSIINSLHDKRGFLFFFVDFLHISKESMAYYQDIKMPKCLVISKSDTIPESVYFGRISEWLKNTFHVMEDILFVRKNSKSSIKKIKNRIEASSCHSIYMAGMTNAGKSTFINALLSEEDKEPVTVSEKPNTTLDFIKIPMGSYSIFDTPGIPYAYYKGDNEFLEKANVSSEIKPITYPMKKGMALVIEDCIRIEVEQNTSVTLFMSSNLDVLKVYEKNERLKDKNFISFAVPFRSQVLMKGIGFLYVKNACHMKIYGLTNEVEVMPSFMGGKNE